MPQGSSHQKIKAVAIDHQLNRLICPLLDKYASRRGRLQKLRPGTLLLLAKALKRLLTMRKVEITDDQNGHRHQKKPFPVLGTACKSITRLSPLLLRNILPDAIQSGSRSDRSLPAGEGRCQP